MIRSLWSLKCGNDFSMCNLLLLVECIKTGYTVLQIYLLCFEHKILYDFFQEFYGHQSISHQLSMEIYEIITFMNLTFMKTIPSWWHNSFELNSRADTTLSNDSIKIRAYACEHIKIKMIGQCWKHALLWWETPSFRKFL